MLEGYPRIKLLYKLSLISILLFFVYVGNLIFFPHQLPSKTYNIIINKNQSIQRVASDLYIEQVITHKSAFLWLLKLLKKDRRVTAGLYMLQSPISLWGLVKRITSGNPDQISITIMDGWTFEALKDYIDNIEEIKHITKNQSESEIKSLLKINYKNLEGLFYPDTYYIAPNQTDLEIYQQSYNKMQQVAESIFLNKNEYSVVKSPYELLILASLITKETNRTDDMYLVSTVFNNRLRIKMKLQDDPAVFYGLRYKTKITRSDFKIDNPYNTYLNEGLTPTPICIPSLNAIQSSAKPLNKTNIYYFVAIGNGRTKFSENYQDHKKAVSQYLKHEE
jgi:UPF0755 protein